MVLFILFYYIYFIYRSVEALHMLQQNLYNENNRYLKWVKNNSQRVYNLWDFLPILFFSTIYLINDQSIIDFTYVATAMIYIYSIYTEYHKNKINQNKIPLNGTSRIKRLFITTFILFTIPVLLLLKVKSNILMATILLISVTMVSFIYYVLYFVLVINMPIDKLVNYYYLNLAKKKLQYFNNLKIIGITGSYGKTSSKNIVNEILGSCYITRPSPKNFNTLKGLMITVNNYLDKFDEIFIAEMGAYVNGEIKEICDFLKPQYGILTTIGDAHLETFGSKENIQKAKFELIESLDTDGLAILNMDDPYQVNYKLQNKVKVVWISLNNEKADFYAQNIKISNKGMEFDCVFEGGSIKLRTYLLGKHNIYNILSAVALSINLGVKEEDIKSSVLNLKPVEHRLELKKMGNFYQLDDAYNSNPVGARNALEVLSLMNGDKCVVTPGMIELGMEEKEKNYEFGKEISKVADWVILIGKKRCQDILNGLIDNNFPKDNIFILNNVVDAYSIINSLVNPERNLYALFENDLPDIYTEGDKL